MSRRCRSPARTKVTIYSDRKPVETTSFKAGGEWEPTIVAFAGKEQEFKAILRTAYTTFENSIGKGLGVSEHSTYTPNALAWLDMVLQRLPGLLPDRISLPRLPFGGPPRPGYRYRTLLIEPPIFLPRLETDLKAGGVTFVQRRFASESDVLTSLTQKTIINCTGLGAKTLWNDSKMVPVKGQVAMLPAQPVLQYLFGHPGYMFPRTDHVVIGGTFEQNVDDETVDKARCKDLVRQIVRSCLTRPSLMASRRSSLQASLKPVTRPTGTPVRKALARSRSPTGSAH